MFRKERTVMPKCTTTTLVWFQGLDIPFASFDTGDEAAAFIRRCQQEDQLEQEFKAAVADFRVT
jgi:hypothetical protein